MILNWQSNLLHCNKKKYINCNFYNITTINNIYSIIIYKLGDIGISSNPIGSLSLTSSQEVKNNGWC